ncbi:MAG: alpha/beta hydrolase [Myxococcota bacterium]
MPCAPTSRFFLSRDGIRLHVLAWCDAGGAGASGRAPVVLLHGGGANAHWWDHVAESISRDQAVYALDFRGHGDSDHPAVREVGAFNVDLESLVDWLGRGDLVFVGHSLGANVALDHASRYREPRGLILVDLARGGSPQTGRRARLALSLRRSYRTREEAIERFRFLPESSHAREALRARIAAHSVREEADGRFGYKFDPAWFTLPSRPPPQLEHVACPTLLVRGSESTLLTREAAETFVARLPAARWVEIPEAGHHVMVDRPDRLVEAIDAFLVGLDRSRTPKRADDLTSEALEERPDPGSSPSSGSSGTPIRRSDLRAPSRSGRRHREEPR